MRDWNRDRFFHVVNLNNRVLNPTPLVSAVIIFLNAQKFIREAISSVFRQSHTNWELLLVDDGSSDASPKLTRRLATVDPGRARYLAHPGHKNLGMSASRNLGIREARGKYIAFLDADDIWLPRKLEEQVAIMELHPSAAMVYGNSCYWHSWTGKSGDRQRDYFPARRVHEDTLFDPPQLLEIFLEGLAAIPPPSSVMVRQEAIARTGAFEEAFRNLYEDQVFFAKVCLKEPVYVSARHWDNYRQHPNSISACAENSDVSNLARRKFLDWLEAYFTDEGVTGERLWNALRREKWRIRHRTLARIDRFARRRVGKLLG